MNETTVGTATATRYCHRCEQHPVYSRLAEAGLCYRCLKQQAESERPKRPEGTEYLTPTGSGSVSLREMFGSHAPPEFADLSREERNDNIQAAYKNGWPVLILASMTGLSRQRVGDIIHGRAYHKLCHSPRPCPEHGTRCKEGTWGCGPEVATAEAFKSRKGPVANFYRLGHIDRKLPENWLTGSQVRAIRRARGLSQLELAKLLDVSPRTVARWETGVSFATGDRLYRLHSLMNKVGAEAMRAAIDEVAKDEQKQRLGEFASHLVQ
jgi:DNA-binding transcriptional regulator YiaG